MPRIHHVQHSWVAGVVSPEMRNRTDFPRYHSALLQGKNILIAPNGAARKRPGSKFEADLGTPGSGTRKVLTFEFSVDDAYALAVSDEIKFARAGVGMIANTSVSTAVVNQQFSAGIGSWTDNSTGTAALSHDAVNFRMSFDVTTGNTAIADQQISVSGTDQNVEHIFQFQIFGHALLTDASMSPHTLESNAESPGMTVTLGSSGAGSSEYLSKFYGPGYHTVAFTPTVAQLDIRFSCGFDPSAGTYSHGLDFVRMLNALTTEQQTQTPWSTDFGNVRTTQVGDVLYLFEPTTPVFGLSRFGHTTWSLSPVAWIDGPYLDANATTTTIGAAATTGRRIAFTASAITGINDDTGFQSTDVGRLLRKADAATPTSWGYAIITEITSTTVVQCDIVGTMPNTTAVTAWQLGAWSEGQGFPRVVGQHEQRLVAARTTEQPTLVWSTAALGFQDFTPGTDAADAVTFNVQAGGQNTPMWLQSIGDVLLGTAKHEILMDQASDQTFGDALPVVQTSEGSAFIDALKVGGALLFVQRTGRRLRELAFRFEQGADGGYRSADLSVLSDHLTNAGGAAGAAKKITEIHHMPERDSTVLAVLDDGVVLACTYARDQEVVAWTEGIVLRSGDEVQSLGVVPVSGGYEIWLATKRSINSTTKYYFERIRFGWLLADDAWYTDCAIEYDSTATTAMTGLTALEAEALSIWADGGIHPSKTVASAALTLDRDTSHAIMGLPYQPTMETMPLADAQAPIRDKHTSLGRVRVNLYQSQAVRIGGKTMPTPKTIPARRGTDEFTAPPPLLTGLFEIPVDGWSKDNTVVIDQNAFSAAPMTVLGYHAPIEVSPE